MSKSPPPNREKDLVPVRLVPVEVFGEEDGYGFMDAVPAWSDCNRADGKIFRLDDLDNRMDGEQNTIEIFVTKENLKKLQTHFKTWTKQTI